MISSTSAPNSEGKSTYSSEHDRLSERDSQSVGRDQQGSRFLAKSGKNRERAGALGAPPVGTNPGQRLEKLPGGGAA